MTWMWHICIANMKQRKIRTVLTVIGVGIGVISIVSLLAIGLGVREILLDEAALGGSSTEITVYGTEGKRKELMLTDRTISEIAELTYAEAVYPTLNLDGMYTYGNYEGYACITGVPQEYLEQMNLLYGEYVSESGIKPELFVGSHALDSCYNSSTGATYLEIYQEKNQQEGAAEDTTPDYSGDTIQFYMGYDEDAVDYRFHIAGVTDEDSYMIYCNIDVLKQFLKQHSVNGLVQGQPTNENGDAYSEWIYDSLVVVADDVEHVDALVKDIQDMGFQAESNKEYIDMIQNTTRVVEMLLGGIGAVALVVAVIGISNTMMTAVYDRIGEIGLLKVLGCDPEELLIIFLLESGILGGAGGLIGIAASYLITEAGINKIAVKAMDMADGVRLAMIPWWLSAGAFLFAVLLGVLAGFFPARWASKLRPIDAVRSF